MNTSGEAVSAGDLPDTATESAAALLITLADVARLAQVQRPVVSVWRKRFASTDDPFPPVVSIADGIKRFDADEVAAWLERTGRGNNATARDDAAAFGFVESIALGERRNFATVSSMLCMKVVSGELLSGLSHSQLVAIAHEVDPSDDFLTREIETAGSRLEATATYADRLADAAYDATNAFELLMAARFKYQLPGHSRTALRADALRLISRVAVDLGLATGRPDLAFVDPTSGGCDLLIEIARRHSESPSPTFITPDADTEANRLVRRRLRVHDLHREPLEVAADGSFEVPSPAVIVAQLPSPDAPSMTASEILSTIDNIVLQMDDEQRALVVAPASVLIDELLSSECRRIRDDLLRSNRVRAILRLPRGLLVEAPRQQLAFIALGPAHSGVKIADRWTLIGDVSDTELGGPETDAIVTDITAGMGDYRSVRSHSFRYARVAKTSQLIARRGALIGHDDGVRLRERRETADVAIRIRQLNDSLGPLDVVSDCGLAVEPVEVPVGEAVKRRSLGGLISSGVIALLPGNRIAQADLQAESGIPVIGTDELLGSRRWGSRRIDHLTFGGNYASGRLTSAGDVVFCTSPSVVAEVDVEGGSIVLAPARVLRITGIISNNSCVEPKVLAADINEFQSTETQWRAWAVRSIPLDQVASFTRLLSAIEHERNAARERAAVLTELAGLVADGVAETSIRLRAAGVNTRNESKARSSTSARIKSISEGRR